MQGLGQQWGRGRPAGGQSLSGVHTDKPDQEKLCLPRGTEVSFLREAGFLTNVTCCLAAKDALCAGVLVKPGEGHTQDQLHKMTRWFLFVLSLFFPLLCPLLAQPPLLDRAGARKGSRREEG